MFHICKLILQIWAFKINKCPCLKLICQQFYRFFENIWVFPITFNETTGIIKNMSNKIQTKIQFSNGTQRMSKSSEHFFYTKTCSQTKYKKEHIIVKPIHSLHHSASKIKKLKTTHHSEYNTFFASLRV